MEQSVKAIEDQLGLTFFNDLLLSLLGVCSITTNSVLILTTVR